MFAKMKRECFENLLAGKRSNSLGIFLTSSLAAFILLSPQARAEALDGASVRDLALQGTWLADDDELGN